MTETTKFLLTEAGDPDALGQPAARPAGRAAAAAAPRHRAAAGPGRPGAALPDGADHAGGLAGAGGRDPGRGARGLPAVAADAAVPRAPPGAGARHARRSIYYKYEGVSPAGSHKPNTAVPQAYYNTQAGVKRLATETGAGQWGSALAFACSLFGLELQGVHGRLELRPEAVPAGDDGDLGRDRVASPPSDTHAGRRARQAPDSTGSLGIAISEAVEDAARTARTATTRSARCSTTCCCTRP